MKRSRAWSVGAKGGSCCLIRPPLDGRQRHGESDRARPGDRELGAGTCFWTRVRETGLAWSGHNLTARHLGASSQRPRVLQGTVDGGGPSIGCG